MKKADFPKAVSDFLSVYLPSQRNFSKNTISSYCDTMKLFLRYCMEEKGCAIERLTLKQVSLGTSFVRVHSEPASCLYPYLFPLCADILSRST